MSPYLLQHASNPVEWWPWSEEAFAEAKRRDVPVFLSVGYSSCHWCHVMAHESFEDVATAEFMNQHFVNIKVDREELPAVDAVYMDATQAMTGRGGWPMSVWLNHERAPWFAGTYFPPEPRHGLPSFMQILQTLHHTWQHDRQRVQTAAGQVTQLLLERTTSSHLNGSLERLTTPDVLEQLATLASQASSAFDYEHGGFGVQPKFPAPLVLECLLRYEALVQLNAPHKDAGVREMLDCSFNAMARGGIYDQIGGGFARYSVDASWTVPHFEKMLYDNAQLLLVYTHWYRQTGSGTARRVVTQTAEFLLNEMQTPEGGFAAALDADSVDATTGDSVEGAYYVWNPSQIHAVLGHEDGLWVCELLGITSEGNFENGLSVPTMQLDPDDWQRWEKLREQLRRCRAERPKPVRDDKVVASWNGLAIRALAEAGNLFGKAEWVDAALRAADLLVSVHLGAVSEHPCRLVRISRDGVAGVHAPGLLEDQALVASSWLTLAQVTSDGAWLDLAHTLLLDIRESFLGEHGLSDLAQNVTTGLPSFVAPSADVFDSVTPSGWAATADAVLTYAALTNDSEMWTWADELVAVLHQAVQRHGRYASWAGAVLAAWADGPREVVVLDDARAEFGKVAQLGSAPGMVWAIGSDFDATDLAELPLTVGRSRVDGMPTAFVCQRFVCNAPTTDLPTLARKVGARVL